MFSWSGTQRTLATAAHLAARRNSAHRRPPGGTACTNEELGTLSLHPIDMAVIAAYIGLTLFIGFWISTRANKG
ncbi:MAG TPA: hypothetical protein DEG72_07690, partial [Hyphomonas sp.]|nr:hypothetical protein [Hyphomonas sp.]